MFADPQSGSQISIQSKEYTFLETPNAPGIVYAEIGRKAKVYRLRQAQDGQYYAFKVFKPRYQNPETVSNTQKIAEYKHVPGLAVVQRTVITPQQHPDLVAEQKHYAYAILMPWIDGKSWFNFLSARTPLSQKDSLNLAHALISVMAGLEERDLAHCDLSSSNFLFSDDFRKVELVDIEDMFGPGLEQPKELPAGTSGYAPGWVKQNGLWEAGADRFSTAMLLGEILAWSSEDIRAASEGDAFFADGEFGNKSKRFQLMSTRLEGIDPGLARLFQTAWYAEVAEECPRIADWQRALSKLDGASPAVEPASTSSTRRLNASNLDEPLRTLFKTFQAHLAARNWAEAQKLQQAMTVLSPDFAEPQQLLEEAQRANSLEQELSEKLSAYETQLKQEQKALVERRKSLDEQRVQIDVMFQTWETQKAELSLEEGRLREKRERLQLADQLASNRQWEAVLPALEGKVMVEKIAPSIPDQIIPFSKKQFLDWKDRLERIADFEPPRSGLKKAFEVWKAFSNIFSPDEKYLLSLGGDHLYLWNIEQKTLVYFMVLKELANVTSALYLPNKQLLAVNKLGQVVKVNLADQNYSVFIHHRIEGLWLLSPEGQMLALGRSDGRIQIFSLGGTEKYECYFGHRASVTALAYSPSGRQLASGSQSGQIILWETPQLKGFHAIEAHQKSITRLVFSLDGRFLASSSADRTIKIWNVTADKLVCEIKTASNVSSLAFSHNSQVITTSLDGLGLDFYSTQTGDHLGYLGYQGGRAQHYAFSPLGNYLALCFDNGATQLWSTKPE